MADILKFAFLGLGSGGAYVLLAIGVVLIYRGSGVVNFAHGAFALLGGAAFVEVRPDHGPWLALAAAVGVGAGAGVISQTLVMRPMRRASSLARVVATLGLVALIQEGAKHRYGTQVVFVSGFLPSDPVRPFGDVVFGEDRLYIAGITIVLTFVLWSLYRHTRVGLATSALAENELATAALGWSPGVIALFNWGAGGALAGLAGALLIPMTGLSPGSLTLTVLPALAAALVGGFVSFPLTLAGGLALGVLESEATVFASKNPEVFGTLSTTGLSSAVPFLAIIILLVARGTALPLRDHLTERLPALGAPRLSLGPGLVALVLCIASLHLFTVTWVDAMTTAAIYGLIALSLVVVTGYCGQVSLAQVALAGLGALISSRAADVWGVPFPLAMLGAIAFSIPLGLVIALPAVRTRGVNLAVATLGLAVVISSMVLSNPKYTGGVLRGTVVPSPTIFGFSIDAQRHPERYGALCLFVLTLGALMVANLRGSASGRRLIAIRNNERAAASLGVGVASGKLYAFGVGAGLASASGVLTAFRNPNVVFDRFDPFASVTAVLQAVTGSIGFISGALVTGAAAPGGLALNVLSHWFAIEGWFLLISAVLLIVVVIVHPDGIAEALMHPVGLVRGLVERRRLRTEVEVASLAETKAQRVPPRALTLERVTVQFGPVRAVDALSLTVRPGQVVGLIGPNGAGKTTVVDAVSGFVPYTGSIRLGDQPLTGFSATRRARAGVARSFQSLELFDDMTVEENLRTAAEDRGLGTYLRDLVRPRKEALSATALACIHEFHLQTVLSRRPDELPYAQRREVAIARSVALGPSVLLLDEPAAGLDATSRRELARLIRRLADEWGIAILLIEHDVAMVLDICDSVTVIAFGAELVTGTPAEVRQDPRVVEAYLGTEAVTA